MANTLGIPEVTLRQAADATNAVNLSNMFESMGGNVVIRITDHKDNEATETGAGTDFMAIFYRKAHGHPWMRRGTRITGLIHETVDASTDTIPTNVEVLYPDFDYTEFE